jgi:hypothetical protein
MQNISPPFLVDDAFDVVAGFQNSDAIQECRMDSLALHDIGGLGYDMYS